MRPTCQECDGSLTRDDGFWYCERCDQEEKEMEQECNEDDSYGIDIRKAYDAGKTDEEQIANVQKVIADYHMKELVANAHPDSILGCIGKLKEALDNFNREKVERR